MCSSLLVHLNVHVLEDLELSVELTVLVVNMGAFLTLTFLCSVVYSVIGLC